MIVSEIIEIDCNQNLTGNFTKEYFKKNKINPVKWYVTSVCKNKAKIFVAFEKKPL